MNYSNRFDPTSEVAHFFPSPEKFKHEAQSAEGNASALFWRDNFSRLAELYLKKMQKLPLGLVSGGEIMEITAIRMATNPHWVDTAREAGL